MSTLILLNKPYQVLCQFTDSEGRATLADHIDEPDIYPAGRLDYDSEGLVALTSDGQLQARIADPKFKLSKTYWVQVEGEFTEAELEQLRRGIELKDGKTLPATATRIEDPEIWPRIPPIRHRESQKTSWIELTIREGRNRQVRRMTAALNHPTLRLIRVRIGDWHIGKLQPGEYRTESVHLPKASNRRKGSGSSTPHGRRRKPQ